jgi:hypothetical protein
MAAYVPPAWPVGVHPPGTERFEDTAVAWLFELVPPDYRRYGVLRRYPVALARMARHHVSACVDAARTGYAGARSDLAGIMPPQVLEAVLDAYRREGTRLVEVAKAVELVETAMRDADGPEQQRTFTPKLDAER